MEQSLSIVFSQHARERMNERGIDENEIHYTITYGEPFDTKFGRSGFRCNFAFGNYWHGKKYACKQVEVIAVQDRDDWLVVTALARYF
jgi:hypothetical protein